MKAVLLGLVVFSFVMAIPEVKSEGNHIRLCGRDFVRAVVFTCGGSRWRRQLDDFPKRFIDEESYPYLPLGISDSTGGSQSKEFTRPISKAGRNLQGQQQKIMSKRQDDLMQIRITCCTIGCSESSISALC